MIAGVVPTMSMENEYEPFSISYVVNFEDAGLGIIEKEPLVTEVTITSSDGRDYSNNIVTRKTSATTFTISGTLSDVFPRSMEYLMPDLSKHVASHWRDIPAGFDTVTKYSGATARSIMLTVNIKTTQGNATSQIEVLNNFTLANAKLADHIKLGKY